MRAVLGIDAAWTETQPSGVALVEETAQGWRLVAVETSYARFRARAEGGAAGSLKPAGENPEPAKLLEACRRLGGREPDLIAVDMPLSRNPIVGRRPSDNAVSSAYGAKKCGTHSPSADRPGRISHRLRSGLESHGYHLWTDAPGPAPGLIEVYPHPALIELTGAVMRLRYKIGKSSQYWPGVDLLARRENIFAIWAEIVTALEPEIAGVAAALPAPGKSLAGAALKSHEDALDAVVCAWVATCVLDRRARAFGDANSAVWVPRSLLSAPRTEI